ncbi:Terminal uridylyltransferase 7, partial [Coemansia sp. RSA 25]
MAKGLGPAGVKRFPYIGSVISTVRSKRDDLTHIDQDFDLAAAITQTIQDHGSVNTTETIGSSGGGGRMHSHHMPLHEVVQKLRRQGVKEWKRVSATRVRTVLDKCAQLAPPDTIAVAGPEPVTGGLEADRGLVVQQAIDACSAVARLRAEEKQAAGMQRFLPTLDHVRAASLSGSLTHTALHELDTGMAAMARHWRPSAHNAGAVDALVAHVEALARAANPGSYVVARLFGSRSYGLCADHSDVDISVSVSAPRGSSTAAAAAASRNRAFFSDLARLLRRAAGFVHVVDVSHARVPIIKFVYMAPDGLRLEGDISLNGSKGLAKSRLVAAYLRLDPRVREVLVVLKLWAMRRNLTCSTTLNSFGLLMMGVAYLISRRVVPPLQLLATAQVSPQAWARLARIQHSPYKIAQLYPAYLNPSAAAAADSGSAGGRHRCLQSAAAAAAATAAAQAALATSSSAADRESPAAVRCLQSGASLPEWPVEGTRAYYLNGGALNYWHSPNRDSAATLLFGMFQYYGFEFDPRAHAISPRLGSPAIARASLPHLAPPIDERLTIAEPNRWRNGLRLLAIEDPFDLT